MCLAIPGKVLSFCGNKATISIMGVTKEVLIDLIDSVTVGEYVIVHAGCAISKINEKEALETLEIFRELEENYHG